MRKHRVQSSKRKTSPFRTVSQQTEVCKRFIGISLSGGKADKTCVAVLEYYPAQKKIFLVRLIEKIKAEEFISADMKIHEIVHQYESNVESVAFDIPLSLPKCMTCVLKCPGYEVCDVDEIRYIRKLYLDDHDKKKPKKMYTPYTQRVVDSFLAATEPQFDFQHALGGNLAPMTARAHYMRRRLRIPPIEVQTRLSVWRLGNELKVNSSVLRVYRNSVGGEQARTNILDAFEQKLNLFIYEQDRKLLRENLHAFEAFICSYVGFMKHIGKTQPRPKPYPSKEHWVEFPAE